MCTFCSNTRPRENSLVQNLKVLCIMNVPASIVQYHAILESQKKMITFDLLAISTLNTKENYMFRQLVKMCMQANLPMETLNPI